ncbi:MAG: hypothetical protein R3Y63_15890, partial [Eubacteriales bacterium]
RWTMNDGRWTMNDGRWTMEQGGVDIQSYGLCPRQRTLTSLPEGEPKTTCGEGVSQRESQRRLQ